MSQARIEVLKLVAEGRITPEDADRILDAMKERPVGPEEAPAGTAEMPPAAAGPSAATEGSPAGAGNLPGPRREPPPFSAEAPAGRSPAFGETLSHVLEQVGDSVRAALDDAAGAMHRAFEEHRPGVEAVDTTSGGFDLPEGALLKVQPAFRVSFGGTSRGGHVIVRPADGQQARILRGEAVEVHRSGTDYVLTWAKGNLELELPVTLSGLEIRSLGGDVEVQGFPGPLALDTTAGEIRADGISAPFRARTLGGRIRITGLAVHEGISTITTTGGDVAVEAVPGCSVTIRASTLGGSIQFPAGSSTEIGGVARRRVTAVLGEGRGELRIDTLGGDVRVAAG